MLPIMPDARAALSVRSPGSEDIVRLCFPEASCVAHILNGLRPVTHAVIGYPTIKISQGGIWVEGKRGTCHCHTPFIPTSAIVHSCQLGECLHELGFRGQPRLLLALWYPPPHPGVPPTEGEPIAPVLLFPGDLLLSQREVRTP